MRSLKLECIEKFVNFVFDDFLEWEIPLMGVHEFDAEPQYIFETYEMIIKVADSVCELSLINEALKLKPPKTLGGLLTGLLSLIESLD